eukprot:SM000205S06225  [mRNA]  locus=s205:133216:134361:- [translate_table: standard]
MRAHLLQLSGDLDAARAGFQDILAKDPFSARAMQGLATLMWKRGEDSLVLGMLEEAVMRAQATDKRKEAINLRILLGQMHVLQGNLAEATKQYSAIIKEDPSDFRPYLCQGLVYSIEGNLEQAEEHFAQYRQRCSKSFPEQGPLDELMLRAKQEALAIQDFRKKDAAAQAKGRSYKPMKQPSVGSSPASR